MVVPHYGKKTINVRLTVSPDSKNATPHVTNCEVAKPSTTKKSQLTPRRRQCRPRKLLSDESDNDDDLDDGESSTTSDNMVVSNKQPKQLQQNNNEVTNKVNNNQTPLIVIDNNNSNLCNKNSEIFNTNNKNTVYESINNLKCCNQLDNLVIVKNNHNKSENSAEICNNCTATVEQMNVQQLQTQHGVNYTIKHHKHVNSSKKKMLRKSRSRRQRVSF